MKLGNVALVEFYAHKWDVAYATLISKEAAAGGGGGARRRIPIGKDVQLNDTMGTTVQHLPFGPSNKCDGSADPR